MCDGVARPWYLSRKPTCGAVGRYAAGPLHPRERLGGGCRRRTIRSAQRDEPGDGGRVLRGLFCDCRHAGGPTPAHGALGLFRPLVEPGQHHLDAPPAPRHLARGLSTTPLRVTRAGAAARIAEGAHRRSAGHDRTCGHTLGDGLVVCLVGRAKPLQPS